MKISIEKTPNQKMSQYAIDVATTVSMGDETRKYSDPVSMIFLYIP